VNDLAEFDRYRCISLATYRRIGAEVQTPVWFTAGDGKLYVLTSRNSGKVKRLRHRIAHMLDGDQRRAYRRRIADDLFGLGYLAFKKWRHRDARRLYLQSLTWYWDKRSVRGIAKTYLARVLGRPEIV